MLNVRLAVDHLYGKLLFTWLLLVMPECLFVLSFFPRNTLDEIWDLIESVLRVFLPTFFQKVIHIDRMRRRYKRVEKQELSQDGVEGQEKTTVKDRNRTADNLKIDREEDTFYDALEHVEETEELGRGARQRQLPLKYSDYVLQ